MHTPVHLSPLVRIGTHSSLCFTVILSLEEDKRCVFFHIAKLGTQMNCEIIGWQRIFIKF